jgi:polyisoprenoid-binding protein YceI
MFRIRLLSTVVVAAIAFGCTKDSENKPPEAASQPPVAEVKPTPPPDPATTAPPANTVTHSSKVIKEKTKIQFVGSKIVGEERGSFDGFDGAIQYAGAKPTGVQFEIDMSTVKTGKPKLDEHLKSPDFFDAATHPKASFTSTSIEAAGGSTDGSTHIVSGMLKMRGEEKPVKFPIKVSNAADGVHAIAEFQINRHDWKVSFPGAKDNLIKDQVTVKLDLAFPPPPSA